MIRSFDLKDLVAGSLSVDDLPDEGFRLSLDGFAYCEDGFVRVTRNNREVRPLAAALANRGFVTSGISDGLASFCGLPRFASEWQQWFTDGDVSSGGIVYSYVKPELVSDDPGLMVVFSSISDKPNSPEMTRYFMQNFPTIGKFLPKDVGVLRLSDVGGMVGAFYMDTVYDPHNEGKVTRFLEDFIAAKGVRKDRVVFYGSSKGGTGALLHGVKAGVRVVSVDPIVDDEHYLSRHNDMHFVTGIFPERKEKRFSRLFENEVIENAVCVISSENSPQLPYIRRIVPIDNGSVVFLSSTNPNIKDHPDVGPNTVNSAVMLMNMCFYDMDLSGVSKKIF